MSNYKIRDRPNVRIIINKCLYPNRFSQNRIKRFFALITAPFLFFTVEFANRIRSTLYWRISLQLSYTIGNRLLRWPVHSVDEREPFYASVQIRCNLLKVLYLLHIANYAQTVENIYESVQNTYNKVWTVNKNNTVLCQM